MDRVGRGEYKDIGCQRYCIPSRDEDWREAECALAGRAFTSALKRREKKSARGPCG